MNISDLSSLLHDIKYFVPRPTWYVFPNKNIKKYYIYTEQQETHLCSRKRLKSDWKASSGYCCQVKVCVSHVHIMHGHWDNKW